VPTPSNPEPLSAEELLAFLRQHWPRLTLAEVIAMLKAHGFEPISSSQGRPEARPSRAPATVAPPPAERPPAALARAAPHAIPAAMPAIVIYMLPPGALRMVQATCLFEPA